MKLTKEINGWLMVLVVLVTAGITSWVMLKKKPGQNWTPPYYYAPQQVAWYFSPGISTSNICSDCHPVISTIPNVRPTSTLPHDHRGICSNCHRLANPQNILPIASASQVAGTTGIPVIQAGSTPMHTDRGFCTNCHTVISNNGNLVPAIGATSTMPHQNRGICSNCHRLANPSNLNTITPAMQPTFPMAAAGQVVAQGNAAPVNTATEGEWMGMEVAPITQLTASQYGIPDGTRGLVVAEAEGQAAVAGLKAGDVVVSVNGAPISNMTEFFQTTQNGTMTQGVVEVIRSGQVLPVNIDQTINPAPTEAPNAPANAPAGAMPAAMPSPQGGTTIYPGNNPGWNGGQGPGNAQGLGTAAPCPQQF